MPNQRTKKRICRRKDGKARQVKAAAKRERKRAYNTAWSRGVAGAMERRAIPYTKMSEAPPDLLERAWSDKYPWISRFVEEGCPRGRLVDYAQQHARAAGKSMELVPPYTTLNTWVKLFRQHGILGLVDKPSNVAGVSRMLTGKFLVQFELLATLGLGATEILNGLAAMFRRRRLPKRPVIARALRRFEAEHPQLIAFARMGPLWFRHVCAAASPHPVVPGGVRLAMDSTVADIFVRIQNAACVDGWEAMRVVLTIVEDVGSRLFVAFNFSLYSIDSGICTAVLGRAVDQQRNYPGLVSVGVPKEMAVDKGSEHLGRFRATLEKLEISVVPRMPDAARGGAHVERLIETVQLEVFKNLPGYSKTEKVFDPYAPDDADTKRSLTALKYEPFRREVPLMQLLTLPQLEQYVLAWARVYNARPHKGLLVESPELQAMLQTIQRRQRAQEQLTQQRASTPASQAA